MKLLGVLLLLAGIGLLVVHFLGLDVPQLTWVTQWGDGVAWAIRGGPVLLGLLLVKMGGKDSSKK